MSDESSQVLPPGVAKGFLRDNLEVVCFAMLIIMFFKTFVGQQFTIPSASMRNTLMIGDHLLVNKFLFAKPQWRWEERLFPMRAPRRGDIIVFRYPMDRAQDFVKRAVALPGDTVEMRDQHFYLNGTLCTGPWEHHIPIGAEGPEPGPWPQGRALGAPERYRGLYWPFIEPEGLAMDRQGREPLPGFRDNLGPFVVPPGQVFALGDNRDNSGECRYWGFVPMAHLRGRPFISWWSFREGGNDDTHALVPEGPGDILRNFVDGVRHFFHYTRWERTGTIPR